MKNTFILLSAAISVLFAACVTAAPADTSDYGRVYGEFQDASLFRGAVAQSPEMAEWSERDICDGLSGATIQAKTLGNKVGDRIVFLNGKKIAYSDGFGQFWISLPEGTYTLTGRSRGYADASIQIIVVPRTKQWVNLHLEKK